MLEHTTRIPCRAGLHQYDIVVGHGFLEKIPEELKTLVNVSKFVIISDENVARLYSEEFTNSFKKNGLRSLLKILPSGESTKCREVKAEVEDWMLKNHCHRDTCVVALGGGVIGDLAGYIASTYMRGISFIQIPTSLLACVDSSIGGKTGIDSPAGKNLIGAFHQPKCVYVDLKLLNTLPKREFINGMAEIIKAGAIRSEELFSLLEAEVDAILRQNPEVMHEMVVQAASLKAKVVTEDEKEHGLRAILNFGHSIGHGLEALLQPDYLHGECVSIGMLKEAEIARSLGYCSSATLGRLIRCLKRFGLPTRVPKRIACSVLGVDNMLEKMAVDKKNKNGVKMIVMLKKIGAVQGPPFAYAVSDDQIRIVVEEGIEIIPDTPARGNLVVPGSKSISNRVLLMAALGKGSCRVTGLLHSDDTQVMMTALMKLGATFEWEEDGRVVVVHGCGGQFKEVQDGQELYLSNAGTAARFLTSCLTLAKGQNNSRIILTGNERMKERPIGPLVDALNNHGCDIMYVESEGCPPLSIKHTGLKGGQLYLEGKVSSQYVSSVLISAPYAKEPITLKLAEEHPTSLPYILMTTSLMKEFGIDVKQEGNNIFVIPTGIYQNPPQFHVEVDASSATYPLAMAAISQGKVTVEGLGKSSLQGDAQFHTVLRKMGCDTVQTDWTTTVDATSLNGGDKCLRSLEIDMETMTDAFMTAAAVASVSKGITRITGIANQRVKECNRIAVMVNELTKLGVSCGELDDGIWIEGVKDVDSLSSATIECHNDHRIAMSFAVLGCAVPDILISDKECTDKTYPEFWDDCKRQIGVSMIPGSKHKALIQKVKHPAIFLVGMRGAGKTSLARATADCLGYNWVDMDDLIEREIQCSLGKYIEENGWSKFRSVEARLLKKLVSNPPENTIISCGGGVVETPSSVDILASYDYVIHVYKEFTDIEITLNKDKDRPAFNEELRVVWERRKPLFERCSSYTFAIGVGENEWTNVNKDFIQFVRTILKVNDGLVRDILRDHTFFLSLTFPNIRNALHFFPKVTEDVNAVELRVDLLESYDPFFIYSQISALRRVCSLPIIFTVRSKCQGGAFEDNEERIYELYKIGVRCGVEFIDMESCWSLHSRENLMSSRRHCLLIGSFHAINDDDAKLSPVRLRNAFYDCYHDGRVDVVKVVVRADSINDSVEIKAVAAELRDSIKTPIISLCTTDSGKLSRVLNTILTPVTHPDLPFPAAPGQMSVKDILNMRRSLGIIPEHRKYYLFGSPIEHSPSPSMHNAAFQASHFSHTYSLLDTIEIHKVQEILHEDNFGGASVTIPHKVSILPLMTELTAASKSIGAVNTVIKTSKGLLGDNTDWIGILRPIERRIRLRMDKSTKIGLVVGAGGTAMAACYALNQLGLKLFVHNRTFSKAQNVASRFHGEAVQHLEQSVFPRVDVVVGTIPASSGFILPDYLVDQSPIVMDAAYKPAITPMLKHAKNHGCDYIQGAEMLCEQAYAQFSLWTNSAAPKSVMKEECYKKLQ